MSIMAHSISEAVTQVNSETRFAPATAVGFNKRMKTNEEIRVENLRALIREAGSEELLAARYKCTPAFIKQMSRGYRDSDTGVRKGIGTAAARKLEECMGKEVGWIDYDHNAESAAIGMDAWLCKSDKDVAEVMRLMRSADQRGRAMVVAAALIALAAGSPLPSKANGAQ